MHGNRTAGVLLFSTALFLAASASAAVGAHGGRLVTSHAAAAGTRTSARLPKELGTLTGQLEDEVAPELSWAASLMKGNSADALKPDKQVCLPNSRCGKPGASYTRPCERKYQDREC